MKRIFLVIFIIASCNIGTRENKNKEKVVEPTTIESDSTKLLKVTKEFDRLYKELIEFKANEDFKKFGFGKGSSYAGWLEEVRKLNENSKLLLEKGLLVSELEALGFEYHRTSGKENHVTTTFNNTFSKKPIEIPKNIKSIEELTYDEIKKNYTLFGEWVITNTFAKKSYSYKIYQKNNEYLGVIPSWNYKKEVLIKKGNNYFISGNKWGEYYKINSKMHMTLYDRDGELKSSGYIAKKVE